MTPNHNPPLALRTDDAPQRAPDCSFRRMVMFASIPVSVFLLHATVFGTWITDDAGISFASPEIWRLDTVLCRNRVFHQ